jgi:predicted O-linked N-acetylglucosamine transferase (SPINDLY family)
MIFLRDTARDIAAEPRRNALCGCGSGKKFKRCCGRAVELRASNHANALEPARAQPLNALFQQGLNRQREGALGEAQAIYENILSQQPRHAAALHLLGSLLLQQGNALRACDLLRQSTAVNPALAQVHSDLGNALWAAGHPEEAIGSYDRAIELDPKLCEAHFNRSVILQQLRRFEEALQSCERAVELQPTLVVALYNRAALLSGLNRTQDALGAYERCLQISPHHVEALNNRGVILLGLQQPEAALESFAAALCIVPRAAEALQNRGNALRRLSRHAEAIRSYEEALAVRPQFFEALLNRGHAYKELGNAEAALTNFDAAVALRPTSAEALFARAEVLADLHRYSEASATLVELLDIAPDEDYAPGLKLYLKAATCNWQQFDEHRRELLARVECGRRAAAPPALLALSDSASLQATCARTFVADRFVSAAHARHRAPYAHRAIRVAYLSGDLRTHPVSRLLVRVLERHDQLRFHTLGLSLRPAEAGDFGERMRRAFDEFIDVSALGSAAIADLIAEREVDILVDLMGFTNGSRFEVLAARPAPIQVNFLGFPGTTGASFIDYILADDFLIPEQFSRHYSEQIARLPDCFQPNDDWSPLAAPACTRAELSLPNEAFVYCCFSNNYKFTPECFEVWMRVLRTVPGSVLWLLADSEAVSRHLGVEAERRGVDARRLIFAERAPYQEYLERLQHADLFLDTFPFNAGATASDALRAGVPVLTCAGEAFASRMAGSLLQAIGLPELITDNFKEYERQAVAIATTARRIDELRERLAEARIHSPLFDSTRYCRHLERAFTTMWERAERAASAASFNVEALAT